jgi:hypothetical protein
MKFLLKLSAWTVLAMCAFSQTVPEGPNTNPTIGPPITAYSKKFYRDGSGNVEYICTARSRNKTSSTTVTGATNASPIVVTSAAHGLSTDNEVTITGVLGNTAANGTWKIIVLSTSTFSLTSSTGNGAYTSGGSAQTQAPRSNDQVWAIQKFYYTGNDIDYSAWTSGASSMNRACDDRLTLSYQ